MGLSYLSLLFVLESELLAFRIALKAKQGEQKGAINWHSGSQRKLLGV
jgi:hypothetical protein